MNPESNPIKFLTGVEPKKVVQQPIAGTHSRKLPAGPPAKAEAAKPASRRLIASIAVAIGIALFGASHWSDGGNGGANGETTSAVTLSAVDIDQEFTRQTREAVAQGLPVPGLSNASRGLLRMIREGRVTFYTVTVRDTHDQDNDVVALNTGAGVVGPMTLTNAGQQVRIPVLDGQPPRLEVIAISDGARRNRVTVGVQTSAGTWFSRVMPERSRQAVPILGVR